MVMKEQERELQRLGQFLPHPKENSNHIASRTLKVTEQSLLAMKEKAETESATTVNQ